MVVLMLDNYFWIGRLIFREYMHTSICPDGAIGSLGVQIIFRYKDVSVWPVGRMCCADGMM